MCEKPNFFGIFQSIMIYFWITFSAILRQENRPFTLFVAYLIGRRNKLEKKWADYLESAKKHHTFAPENKVLTI